MRKDRDDQERQHSDDEQHGEHGKHEGDQDEQDENNQVPASPLMAGQVRKFVVEVWDGGLRRPSAGGHPHQDYWVIDILAPDSAFDTTLCQTPPPPPTEVTPPPVVTPPPAPSR